MFLFPNVPRIRRLPFRYGAIVMPFVLSVAMTYIVSAVSTIRTLGLTEESLVLWPSAWALSWVFAFPTLLVLLPIVRRIVGVLVEPTP